MSSKDTFVVFALFSLPSKTLAAHRSLRRAVPVQQPRQRSGTATLRKHSYSALLTFFFFPAFHLATKKISNHSIVPVIQLMLLSPFGLCSLTTKLKLLEDFSL